MSNASKPAPLARLRVQEKHGIRRFLYPLTARLPMTVAQLSRLRVAEESGALVPSESLLRRGQTQIGFAVSLAPRERRTLYVIETDASVAIPDPIHAELMDEAVTLRQERVATTFVGNDGLRSVVYDGAEHLAGPLTVSRDGAASPSVAWEYAPIIDGLSFAAIARGMDFKTRYDLTACKSWVRVVHTILDAPAETEIMFALPLVPSDETPTCDFGVGNGAYAKIGGDAVTWTVDFAREPHACWEIAHLGGEQTRLDYEGATRSRRVFASEAWFHWSLKTRAVAVAVTHIPPDCAQLRASLGRDGVISISFRLARRTRRARFGVCYHFLNDIAAIAAATNPASILLPPEVKLRRLE